MRRLRVEFGMLLLLAVAPAALAADHGSAVSGVVRDVKGVPQAGALVQILSPDASVLATAYTDLQGRYTVTRLFPGLYGVRATAAMFLPATRNKLRLMPDRGVVVNLTLSGLFDELAWLPAKAKAADEAADDWNWTLRSSANRPILKLADDDLERGAAASPEQARRRPVAVRAKVSVGSAAFGRGTTRMRVGAAKEGSAGSMVAGTTSMSLDDAVGMGGQAGDALGLSTTVVRAMGPAGAVASRVSYETLPGIVPAGGGPGLTVMTVSSAERFLLGDFADVEAGSRVEAMEGPAATVISRPFLRVRAHGGSPWMLTYALAASPDVQDFDSAIWGDGEIPVVTAAGGRARATSGLHQELSITRRSGATLVAIALYADDAKRVAISGQGDAGSLVEDAEVPLQGGALLIDRSNGSFRYVSDGYHASGVNVLVTRKVGQGASIALQYCTGAALGMEAGEDTGKRGDLPPLQVRESESVTVSVKARVARTRTSVRGSYRWQPGVLVTPVAAYDELAGGDFLSFHVRQPISFAGWLPEGTELTMDGSNVLGQGYRRFVGRSGVPQYLASSPAGLQAGLTFSF